MFGSPNAVWQLNCDLVKGRAALPTVYPRAPARELGVDGVTGATGVRVHSTTQN